MRSSNYKNSNQLKHAQDNSRRFAKPAQKTRKISKLGSIIVTAFIVFAAVIIPGVTFIQNVEAVTNVKNNVLNIGGSKVFSDVIAKSDKKQTAEKFTEATQPVTEAETKVEAPKAKAIVACANIDTTYKPKHVNLSAYDRAKVERLVMGEAGGMGYKGSALVAQTIRDTMVLEKNNSIDYIISSYQYEGSTDNEPTAAVKKAVSYIFDNDGYAVQHRLIYFYASDLIESEWHETQDYVASCGAERFFDRVD